MFRVPLVTSCSEIPVDKFWKATLLYHRRPNLINRKIMGSAAALFVKVNFCSSNIKRITELITRSAILYEVRKLKDISKEHIDKNLIINLLETYDKNVEVCDVSLSDFESYEDGVFVSVQILLPRSQHFDKCVQVVVFDKKDKLATFLTVVEIDKRPLGPVFSYDIELVPPGSLRVCVNSFEDADSASAEWLADQLFPKLLKWAEESETEAHIQQSLSLLDVEKYTHNYLQLKAKYADDLIKVWTERTDPLKFVHEDVAIAAYLISLWESITPNQKPTFVDLGCGNGLLVYILSQEGYSGYGIDVRKRKIWDSYPTSTSLKVQTITPSENCLFPDSDWIIGNHSDELTPWIPVIASRSSYKTNFFLLPCCCYEFNGQKYKRSNSSVSIYAEYLDYIKAVCIKCGFNIKVDKLRIPSTKRTCIVSYGRFYNEQDFRQIDEGVAYLIKEDKCNELWINNFQPRNSIEKVRNCTQLDRTFINDIINKVSTLLLSKEKLQVVSNKQWNEGGTMRLPELVDAIEREDLKKLKNECGGLQTLLRNHRYIFEVDKGSVKLRLPLTVRETQGKYKSKPCWFYLNHPNGCLHDGENCSYNHNV